MKNQMKNAKNIYKLLMAAAIAISVTNCASAKKSTPLDNYLSILPPPETTPPVTVSWGYLGDRGPEFWHYLDPSFYLAGEGKAQSPIDINTSDLSFVVGLAKPIFRYGAAEYILYDDSHTIIVIPKTPNNRIILDDREYILQHFEFHTPGEHTIDGKSFDVEIHFFHEDAAGNIAVVSVLLEEGEENQALRETFSYMSWIPVGGAIELDEPVDLSGLFDDTVPLYRYDGSLTMPPCTEGVKWNIYSRTITAAKYQLVALKGIYVKNNRHVKKLNERSVYIPL
jgi:carbonic anhydrase